MSRRSPSDTNVCNEFGHGGHQPAIITGNGGWCHLCLDRSLRLSPSTRERLLSLVLEKRIQLGTHTTYRSGRKAFFPPTSRTGRPPSAHVVLPSGVAAWVVACWHEAAWSGGQGCHGRLLARPDTMPLGAWQRDKVAKSNQKNFISLAEAAIYEMFPTLPTRL